MCRLKKIIYKYDLLNNSFVKELVNNLFLVVIAITFLLMSFDSLLFFVVFLIYISYLLLRKKKEIIVLILCLSFIISISFVVHNKIFDVNRHKNEEISIEGLIINKDTYQNYGSSYFKYKIRTRNIIYKNSYVYSKDSYEIGDYIRIDGVINEIDGEKIEHGFNYEKYLNHSRINCVITANETSFIKKRFTLNVIKKYVYRYLDNNFKGDTKTLIKGLVLGDTSEFNDELKEEIKSNGILHLFAISGLHINLFIQLLVFFLSLLKVDKKKEERIIISFLFLYLIVTTFAVSIVRASLMYVFKIINKRYLNNVFTNLDVISIVFFVLLLINPYYAYNTGFVLSFVVSFIILLLQVLLQGKSNSKQILIISLVCNIFTLPIIINMNYEYNLLSPIINVLYINIVSLIILPFALFTIAFPFVSSLFDYIVNLFLKLISFTSNINFSLRLPYFSDLYIFIFYLLLILILIGYKKIKYIASTIFLLFIVFLYFFGSYTLRPKIDFLYLNDGEATVLRYMNKVILIDTGDGKNNEVMNFLLSKGIKRINYIIITHDHDDHYGGMDGILQKIKVDYVLVSEYSKLKYDNLIIIKPGDNVKCGCFELCFLAPIKKGYEENDNSIIFVLNVNYKNNVRRILFMGDATTKEESDVIEILKEKYNHIDILKVGHHGSTSSTTPDLINKINIDNAVIMVGEKRKKTHPSNDVVQLLKKENIKIFDTIRFYSISIKITKDELIFNTLKE